MAKHTIKFSYPFKKLIGTTNTLIETAMLLQVLQVDLIDITQEMRDYDTDFGKYPLPAKGKYILLVFMKPHGGGLFTTFRPETLSKLEHFLSLQGNWFNIEISHDINTVEQ